MLTDLNRTSPFLSVSPALEVCCVSICKRVLYDMVLKEFCTISPAGKSTFPFPAWGCWVGRWAVAATFFLFCPSPN